jgi:surfeit locus 1 family protein
VIALPMIAALIGLGAWQLDRRAEKAALIDRIESRATAEPVALPAAVDDPRAWDYRRVAARGTYLHGEELYLVGRTLEGRVGFEVVTPLRLDDRQRGGPGYLLVNRGWVPDDRLAAETRQAGRPSGTVTVDGVLRRPGGQGWMQPANEPSENRWFWVDIPAMAEAAGLPGAVPAILEAAPGQHPGRYPVGGRTRVDIPNNHLQYAITWFGLAAALAAIYVLYHLRRPGDGRAPSQTE